MRRKVGGLPSSPRRWPGVLWGGAAGLLAAGLLERMARAGGRPGAPWVRRWSAGALGAWLGGTLVARQLRPAVGGSARWLRRLERSAHERAAPALATQRRGPTGRERYTIGVEAPA